MKAEFELKKKNSGGATLLVKGDLTVRFSKEFKERLKELMEASGKGIPAISLRDVTSIDVTAIQLILAATREYLKSDTKISLTWPDAEGINTLLSKIGIKQALQKYVV